MNANRATLLRLLLGIALFVGAGVFVSTFIGPDSPYDRNTNPESYPVGPEKPTVLDSTSATNYAVRYEERILYNDLLTSRGHSLDTDDEVITDCRDRSVSNADSGWFRVRVECRGGIDDTLRLFEPDAFTYSVTYRITNTTTRQIELREYPFGADRRFNNETE